MRSLYSKFVLSTIAIMLLSTTIGFLGANTYYHLKLKPENDSKNITAAKRIAAYIESEQPSQLDEYLDVIGTAGYQIIVYTPQKDRQLFGAAFREHNLEESNVEAVLRGEVYHGMKHFPRETFVTGFFANEMSNTVGVPFTYEGQNYALFLRPDIKFLFGELHTMLAWMTAIMLALSLLSVFIASRLLIHPVMKLTQATEELVNENFDIHLEIERQDEIGKLAKSFNEMVGRLRRIDESRKSFIANVSHEIQTPLLNIQGYTNLLQADSSSPVDRQMYLQIVQEEAERMSAMSKQLLVLTSVDQASSTEVNDEFEPLAVQEQLKEILNRLRWLLDEKEITVQYRLDEAIIRGNASLLYNVWENLISNAIKYNQPQGSIEVTLYNEEEKIRVCVADTGKGLTEEQQTQIFERFYRADPARSRTSPGTGLGLAIVEQVVKLHKGKIKVKSKLNEGTTICVDLPKL